MPTSVPSQCGRGQKTAPGNAGWISGHDDGGQGLVLRPRAVSAKDQLDGDPGGEAGILGQQGEVRIEPATAGLLGHRLE